ncbi:MAG: type I restriction endonuclease subunit M, partial [Bacteroidota bacterium]
QSIHESANLSKKTVKNIWSYFLIRSCELLTDDGVLAFVLPAELLQVNFSIELRQYLIDNFDRTEIFTFDDLLFECKGQDTVLLIAYKKHKKKGQYFTHISNVEQLQTNDFILTENTALETSKIKWTHHTLSSDELTFMYKLGDGLKTINDYCNSKPGIVTAGNDFFIVNEETELKYALTDYVQPVIQKGFFVNGSVVFDHSEFDNLVNGGKPTKVLAISDNQVNNLPASVCEYLNIGANEDFSSGYKCSKRKHWFVVPNIASPSDGFFFRRVHNYPKLLKNEANVLVTDSAYKIDMKPNFSIDNLIYSFYNSLTLAFNELLGRYYGGGVLELTPGEFKNLPVPYLQLSVQEFNQFRKIFEDKSSIDDILINNDAQILNTSLNLSAEEIEKIQAIRNKLITKRLRK